MDSSVKRLIDCRKRQSHVEFLFQSRLCVVVNQTNDFKKCVLILRLKLCVLVLSLGGVQHSTRQVSKSVLLLKFCMSISNAFVCVCVYFVLYLVKWRFDEIVVHDR